ncbi:hypothetical protein BXP70_25455 [Hymenobacter crusticola]|uniref:SbsA Ig-like domain-containing protein n=1 Tax=Hymenobacter crusticola TaxID=1770526 RepID=A0A243W6Z0_9BACT|nr:hypothetical protein BXP70_25455 [Hymenobacter crusticola]
MVGAPAQAQAPTLTSLAPVRNALAVPRTTALTVGFSQPLSSSSAQGVCVFSTRRGGRLTGTTTISGSTLRFTPAQLLQAGETVSATLTSAVRSLNDVPLAQPQVVRFTTATTPSAGLFTGGSDPAITNAPYAVAAGDLNGDGWPDLITHNAGNRLSIRLNTGTGTFSGGPDVGVLNGMDLAVGDVDNDGDLDLVVDGGGSIVGPPSGTAVLVRNNGAAGFSSSSISFPARVTGVALGDVNGDGYVDVIGALAGALNIRLNDGQGNFLASGQLVGGGNKVVLGDLDNDGDLDLVATELGYPGRVLTLLNDGAGTFRLSETLPTSSYPLQTRLGDVDGDGDLDVVTVIQTQVANTPGVLNLFRNEGQGTFTRQADVLVTVSPQDVALGDVDGDGDLDLVSVSLARNTASVRLNAGTGSFSDAQEVSVGNRPYSVVLADVDDNGTLDLLTANETGTSVSVRLNSQVLATSPRAVTPAWQLYPNPAHEQVQVELPAAFRGQAVQLCLCNALGQVVREQSLNPTAPQLSVAGLAAGLYTMHVRTSQQQLSTRLLIE